MRKLLLPVVAVLGLGLAAYGLGTPVHAQVPTTPDSIDILFDPATCRVDIRWNDGTQHFVDLLTTTVQTGAVVVEKDDKDIADVAGDQSQILLDFVVPVGTHTVRSKLYDGEREVDDEQRTVVCVAPTPTPSPTATPAPTNTPVVVTATPAPQPTATATAIILEPDIGVQLLACLASGGTWTQLGAGGVCQPKPIATQAPAPGPATVAVTQPATSVISPPRTGSGGLLNVMPKGPWIWPDLGSDAGPGSLIRWQCYWVGRVVQYYRCSYF